MKKSALVLALVLAAGNSYGQGAYSGIFGSGAELTGTGAGALNNGTATIYTLGGGSGNSQYLTPTGSTAMLSTVAFGTAAAPTPSLGTFTTGDSLILNGGSILTYQGGSTSTDTDVVNTAVINYQIEDAATNYFSGFQAVNLTFNANGIGGAASSMRFSTETLGTNLLAGLAPGTYTIDIYNDSTFTETNTTSGTPVVTTGTNYDSNYDSNGNPQDYGATFTIVPEPGTVPVLLMGLGGVMWSLRRFHRAGAPRV